MSPIFLLLPIAGLLFLLGKGVNMSVYPSLFAIFFAYVFLALALVYWMLCKKNNLKAASAASAVANGVLFVYLSGIFQSPEIFSWFGFALLFVGMLRVITLAAPPTETLFARKVDSIVSQGVDIADVHKILDSIPFPCAFLERGEKGQECVAATNASFASLVGSDKSKIGGQALDSLLPAPVIDGNMKHAGSEWAMKRTARGKQALVTFTPAEKPGQAIHFDVFDAIDPLTGLYAAGFMKYKARSDIESVVRGKRRMSVALFKLSFHKTTGNEVTDDEKNLAYVAFGRMALESVRVCDSAYRVSDDEVLIYMPDTPPSGAKVVASRVHASLRKVTPVECPKLTKAQLLEAVASFTGGMDLPGYERILEEMRVSLYRKNPEAAPELGNAPQAEAAGKSASL